MQVIKQDVTRQDMVDFIMAQPDEREVDFDQTRIRDECGCLMVQYGKANGFRFYRCGPASWVVPAEYGGGFAATLTQGTFAQFVPVGPGMRFTYAEVKQHCKEMGWA